MKSVVVFEGKLVIYRKFEIEKKVENFIIPTKNKPPKRVGQ